MKTVGIDVRVFYKPIYSVAQQDCSHLVCHVRSVVFVVIANHGHARVRKVVVVRVESVGPNVHQVLFRCAGFAPLATLRDER